MSLVQEMLRNISDQFVNKNGFQYPSVTMHLQAFMCVFRYRLAGLPGDYQEKNISSPETNYCLLKDLIIWTQYQIQVAAYTGAGLGVYSQPVTEYTLQGGRWRRTRTFSFLIYASHSKYTEHFQSSLHTERHLFSRIPGHAVILVLHHYVLR